MKSNSSKLHIAITVAVMALIFMHSAMPGDISGNESRFFANILVSITGMNVDTASFVVRKSAHFTEYLVLGGCLLLNVKDWNIANVDKLILKPRQMWALAWILATAYAVTDEIHQRFVPGRSCEIRDVCIDAAGAALGAVAALNYGRCLRARRSIR